MLSFRFVLAWAALWALLAGCAPMTPQAPLAELKGGELSVQLLTAPSTACGQNPLRPNGRCV